MSAATVTPIAPTTELMMRVTSWPERAQSLNITDEESYGLACSELQSVKALEKEIDDTFDPIVRKQLEAHREAVAQKKRHREPLEQAEAIYKRAITGYTQEQERIRIEEQRRLEREARARQEAELEKDIEHAEAQGASVREIERMIERPIITPPVVVAPAVPKVAGVATRETWKAQVTNLQELVEFVAKNPQYVNLLDINSTALNQLARAQKALLSLPGVKVWREDTIAARRA